MYRSSRTWSVLNSRAILSKKLEKMYNKFFYSTSCISSRTKRSKLKLFWMMMRQSTSITDKEEKQQNMLRPSQLDKQLLRRIYRKSSFKRVLWEMPQLDKSHPLKEKKTRPIMITNGRSWIMRKIKTEIILRGLRCARKPSEQWRNFHLLRDC